MWKPVFAAVAAAGACVAALASGSGAQGPSVPGGKTMLRVVVHVNFADADRQGHGLKNIENILKEAGDTRAEVVCHGAGIALVVREQSKHAAKVAQLIKRGVRFAACENTMREKGLKKDDLVPGVTTVPSGAVEVIRKQQQGYGYFRP